MILSHKSKMLIALGIGVALHPYILPLASHGQSGEPQLSQVSQVNTIPRRNPVFAVPSRLRPRVDFWIDIFTRYGKDQVVIHHREYPQATFAELDFRNEIVGLSPIQAEKYRKAKVEKTISEVRAAIARMAEGRAPSNSFEQRVVDSMMLVPGNNRYQRTLEDKESIRSQTGIREKYADAMRRSGQYIEEIERIFTKEYGLPKELTRLPFIESSFDYRAYSSVGAAGIWQFMRRTGMSYLTINKAIDERRDPIASTRAAARYLQNAYEELGTWPLALTSYNHGVAGVARKARAYGTSDIVVLVESPFKERPFGFASTNFYPEFLAALDVYDQHDVYFPGLELDSPVEVRTLQVPRAVSVSQLSRDVRVPIETLKSVNLALTEAVWNGKLSVPKGYNLKIPLGQIEPARQALASVAVIEPQPTVGPNPAYSSAVYRVKKGDNLAVIAKRYGVTVEELKNINHLEDENIRIGQQLVIGRPKPIRDAVRTTSTNVVTYVVRSGDSLHSIAKRYGVTVARIRSDNNLSSTKLSIGQKIKITKPARN